ncbi:uncharacterized protein PAC_07585 [Phialocephala subalpina]|uniref:Uncharacterized protein n=1 Tax=Phialocephala subalpina TaxID=576137 RepID=A0A1L7WY53_9HELO|nr:uncharacterized protein PAC_07585 [Phialocephala subalpina]
MDEAVETRSNSENGTKLSDRTPKRAPPATSLALGGDPGPESTKETYPPTRDAIFDLVCPSNGHLFSFTCKPIFFSYLNVTNLIQSSTGPNDRRNRNPQDNRRVPLHRRYRLFLIRAPVRQNLHLLLAEMGLNDRDIPLRNQVCDLRRAPNSTAFIIGRAVAGWGFSGILTGGTVNIQRVLPLHIRPMAMEIMGAIFGISSRWCFYINLPFGGISMAILALFLKATAPTKAGTTFKAQVAQLDPLGTICFLPSIICLLLALQWGGSTSFCSNPRIIVLFFVFAILLTLFIVTQILKKEPEHATVLTHTSSNNAALQPASSSSSASAAPCKASESATRSSAASLQGRGSATNVAAQTVIQQKDIAVGSALMMFASQISGAVFVPAGNAVFENESLKRLMGIPGVDGNLVLNTGATEIRNVVSPDVLDAVLEAHDGALTKVFLVAAIMAAVGLLSALCMEWKSVKKYRVKKGKGKGADVESAPVVEKA